MLPLKARKVSKRTYFNKDDTISIIIPESKEVKSEVEKLVEYFNDTVVTSIVSNPDYDFMYNATGHIILVGNLSDNRCVEHLYYKYLLVTDLTYPGPGGYELRTLLNPLGKGNNIIQIGYSDQEGLKKAVIAIEKYINSNFIDYICDLSPTQLHIPKERVEYVCKSEIDYDDETYYYTALHLEDKGYIAYLNGDPLQLEKFNEAVERFVKSPALHLKLYRRVMIWRLLEVTGMLRDDLYEVSINFFYDWADGPEGTGSFTSPRYQSPYFPRQNHGLMPAFGVWMLADYFQKYYPDLEKPPIWKGFVKKVFAPYEGGSWKPLCDGLCHGWWMAQPAMLDYFLFENEHKYFEVGGAEKSGTCAMTVINNGGWMPCAGDASHMRNFPHYTLDICAAFFMDGRYRFISELAPEWRRAYNYHTLNLLRRFDKGVEPVEPVELLGVKVIPMDSLVYESWEHEPKMAPGVSDTPPYDEIEKCFDKISFRTGFNKKDDYLLIDGLGGGSHSYADAMAILDYEVHGISFIVAEDALIFSEPNNENTVTIYRDGIGEPIPSFPTVEKIEQNDDAYYLKLKSTNYNGAIWEREYYMIPSVGLVVQDKITAEKSGKYALESHFRCPGVAEINDSTMHITRRNDENEIYDFQITTMGNIDLNHNIREISFTDSMYRTLPGSPPPTHEVLDGVYYLKKRYHLNDEELYLNSYEARTTVDLEEGESVTFTTVALPIKQNGTACFDEHEGLLTINTEGRIYKTPFEYSRPTIKTSSSHDVPRGNLVDFGGGQITFAKKCSNNDILTGLEDGCLYRFKDGAKELINIFEGKINSADYNGKDYVVSHGDVFLSLFDSSGKIRWTIDVERIPTLYPWWELNEPTIVNVLFGKYKGADAIIAGCGDDFIHYYNMSGDLIGKYYFDTTGVPDLLEIFDINQDGINELIIASSSLTCTSQVDIIDEEGECLEIFGGEGWTSITSALRCFKHENKTYIAHGIRQRKNCELREFTKTSPGAPIQGRNIIKEQVAGAVMGFAVLPEHDLIVAGTNQGFIIAYNMVGEKIWFNAISNSIHRVAELGDEIVLVDTMGTVYIYTLEGRLSRSYKTDIEKPYLFVLDKNLIVAGGNKLFDITPKRP